MTRKDWMKQNYPDKVSDDFIGGVSNCPGDYRDDWPVDNTCGICCNHSDDQAALCEKCWNTECHYEYINHPNHYGGEDNPYECIKVIEAWGLDKNFDLGTALRYICRAGEKPNNPAVQDLKKAIWYLQREVDKYDKD